MARLRNLLLWLVFSIFILCILTLIFNNSDITCGATALTSEKSEPNQELLQKKLSFPLGTAPKQISSTFGEFRPSHFHGGVDLRTNGCIGFPVYAIEDGILYRIKYTKRGYGKAVYIRHPDGIISVYGHLDRFEDEALHLERFLSHNQEVYGKYIGDAYRDIAVKKGQLIGYSGETGDGLPHLHFELRDVNENQLNPLANSLSIPDNQAPILEELWLRPKNSNSLVSGSTAGNYGQCQTLKIPLAKAQDKYISSQKPILTGTFELCLKAYDQISADNRCGLDTVAYSIDGKEYFNWNFSKLGFDRNGKIGLLYLFPFCSLSKGYYVYRLARLAGNNLYGNPDLPVGAGILDTETLSYGLHKLRVSAKDASGLSSEAVLDFYVNHLPEITEVKSEIIDDQKFEAVITVSDQDKIKEQDALGLTHVIEVSSDLGKNWLPDQSKPSNIDKNLSESKETWHFRLATKIISKTSNADLVIYRIAFSDNLQKSPWCLISSPPKEIAQEDITPKNSTLNETDKSILNLVWTPLPEGIKVQLSTDQLLASEPLIKVIAGGIISTNKAYWTINEADPIQSIYEALLDFRNVPEGLISLLVEAKDLQGFSLSSKTSIQVYKLSKDLDQEIDYPGISLKINKEDLYEPATVFIQSEEFQNTTEKDLPAASLAFDLYPEELWLAQASLLKIKIPEGQKDLKKLGIYWFHPVDKDWIFLESKIRDDSLSSSIMHFGRFALLKDLYIPKISDLKLVAEGWGEYIYPTFSATILEKGMGIDERRTIMTINEAMVDAEYDPDRQRLYYQAAKDLASGQYKMTVVAFDLAGNRASATKILTW